MTCKCPNCGAALTVMLAAAGVKIEVPEAKVTVAKAPKFTNSIMGRLRKCIHAVGLNSNATIFNDLGVVRQDGTQRRRLKIWNAGGMSPKQSEQLGLACERAFGEDLIKAGVVSLPRPGRSPSKAFCVYLKVQ